MTMGLTGRIHFYTEVYGPGSLGFRGGDGQSQSESDDARLQATGTMPGAAARDTESSLFNLNMKIRVSHWQDSTGNLTGTNVTPGRAPGRGPPASRPSVHGPVR